MVRERGDFLEKNPEAVPVQVLDEFHGRDQVIPRPDGYGVEIPFDHLDAGKPPFQVPNEILVELDGRGLEAFLEQEAENRALSRADVQGLAAAAGRQLFEDQAVEPPEDVAARIAGILPPFFIIALDIALDETAHGRQPQLHRPGSLPLII